MDDWRRARGTANVPRGPGWLARPPRRQCLQLRRHRLDFGVGLEGLVAHLTAPAGLLVPAERQGRVEDVVAVDPDGPGAELLRQGVGLGDVPGPDPGPEAVAGVVRLGGDLVQAAERLGHDDRAEDLLADDLHVRAGVGDDGGLDEVTLIAEAPAAGDRGGALGHAGLQEPGDPPQLLLGYQRAHLRAGLHARAELDALGDFGDAVDHLVEAVFLDEE